MALVQWKQISPQLGDYGQLTGSLEVTGSFILNGQELDLSGGVVSSNQTLSLNGYELSISNGNTVTLPQGGGSADTGSLITSASANGNVITFTNGDGTTFDITIDTGSAGTATDISALNAFTSSYFVDSASFDNRILNITGSTVDTSSLDARLDALEAATSSYTTGPHTDITALNSFTSSYSTDSASFDNRINSISSTGVPQGTISSSAQITALGFISESSSTDITALNSFTSSYYVDSASFDQRFLNITGSATDITALNSFTSSYYIDSASIHQKFLNITGSSVDTSGLLTTASYQIDSSSFDSRITSLAATGSVIAPFAFGFVNDTTNNSGTGISWGNWNSSNATLDFTFTTAQPDANYAVVTDSDTFDNYYVGISNKTTTGFRAEFYDDTQSRNPSSFSPFTFVVYGSNPLQSVRVSVSGSAGATDISALNSFTSSYYLDSASFDSRILNITSSGGSGDVTFDGNRIVSNDLLGDLYTDNFNAGTTGSIQDFLNAVFFPNTAPVFTNSPNFTITEFQTTPYTVGTLTATDPEGQSLTFSTASAYTANYVSVSSNGVITLNNVPTTETFNTVDRGDGTLAHPVQVKVTDTFGAVVTSTVYIHTVANSAPVFRQTSTSGPIINSYTINRNENDGASSNIGRIYFTDSNSDNITITTQADPQGHFSLTTYSNYVQIAQVTGSLDYETTTSYTLSITGSDEHYQAGQDTDSIITIPITINVVDNVTPVVNDQTLSSISENSNNGQTVDSIAASDNEADTITYSNFSLIGLRLDGGDVPLFTYSGTSQSDPTENPFQMDSSGNVTRKAGVYINSDLINEYRYVVQVRDSYNNLSNPAIITIPIEDDPAPALLGIEPFYIIESATTGDNVYDTPTGYSGTRTRLLSDQSVTWTVNPTSLFSIDSSGFVTINTNISGSNTAGGDQLTGSVTASNSFGTFSSQVFSVNVTDNQAPNIIFYNFDNNLNTNGARPSATLVSISFSDPEGNSVDLSSFTFNDPSGQLTYFQSGDTFQVVPTSNLTAGNYTITCSIQDSLGFATRTSSHTFTIAQAPTGILTTNGTFRIIESAVAGDNIVINSNGLPTGTQADLGVNYLPNYSNAAVQTFASSNPVVLVDNVGRLSLGSNISGSGIVAGNTITSTITFTDQYSNVGTDNIIINVVENTAPTVTITDNQLNNEQAVSGSNIGSISISDSESDTPFTLTLSGADAGSFNAIPQNAASSSWIIQPTTNLSAGSYSITANASDSFSKVGSTSGTFVVSQAADFGKVYIYTSTRVAGGALAPSNYFGLMGGAGTNSDTPPLVTSFTADTSSPFLNFVNGSVGDSTISVTGGTLTLRATVSGSNLDTITSGSFNAGGVSEMIVVMFPSGSDMSGTPTSMTDTLGGSTNGEYVMFVKGAGETSYGASGTAIHALALNSPHEGYSKWNVIGRTDVNAAASYEIRIIPSSGSAPS